MGNCAVFNISIWFSFVEGDVLKNQAFQVDVPVSSVDVIISLGQEDLV